MRAGAVAGGDATTRSEHNHPHRERAGYWSHTAPMRHTTQLDDALRWLGLIEDG
jgi:hypothetical protein